MHYALNFMFYALNEVEKSHITKSFQFFLLFPFQDHFQLVKGQL